MTDMPDVLMSYNFYKKKFEKIKPIRGRSIEVRPIGDRRRDWEQIKRRVHADGSESFICHLYSTDVVEYYNDGRITLRTNGWQSVSTGQFIHEHSPFICWKENKKLWIKLHSKDGAKVYPIGREITVVPRVEGTSIYWEPSSVTTIQKRVVDREKAKAARAPVMPFLKWAEMFLKLSDGWIMHETRKAVIPFNGAREDAGRVGFHYTLNGEKKSRIYETICNATEEDYLRILCELAVTGAMTQRVAETVQNKLIGTRTYGVSFYDSQYEFKFIKQKVYSIVEQAEDIYRVVDVEPSDKAIGNAV